MVEQADPTGRQMGDDGTKRDAGKAGIYTLCLSYFPRAIEAIAQVSEFGLSEGYARMSWLNVPDGKTRYADALMRHLLAEAKNELVAQDSELLHAAHEAWNALARLELLLREDEAASLHAAEVKAGFTHKPGTVKFVDGLT